MPAQSFFTIPGFNRYHVVLPFAVVDKVKARVKSPSPSNGRYSMKHDDGSWRTMSVAHVAALAFHGQQPLGYLAWHMGDTMQPSTVKWWPARTVRSHTRARMSYNQVLDIREAYLSDPSVTQRQLAARYGVSRSTISYAINRR